MKIRLHYQAVGKFRHWVMEVQLDTPEVYVKTKILYQHYSHPSYPPPRSVTEPDAHRLVRTAHAAAEIQAA